MTLIDLVEGFILPILRGFCIPGEGIVDLNRLLATERTEIIMSAL